MESLLIIFFILLTSAPLSSPSRSHPLHKPATHPSNRSGFSIPIYHQSHPMVQKQLDSFSPISKDDVKTKFLMKVNFGNPMDSRLLVLDTGSDLCWILEDGYNRSASSSLHELDCGDERCDAVPSPSCSLSDGCHFGAEYVDGTSVEGDVLLETFYLYDDKVKRGMPTVELQMPLGLASSDGFIYQGVLGLNFGKAGLLSYMPYDKFSVCFPDPSFDHSLDSFVRFGGDASLFGECVSIIPSRYHLVFFVNHIRIGGYATLSKLSDLPSGAYFVFDTGAEQSYLPHMDDIVGAIRRIVQDTEVYSLYYELCYKKEEGSSFPEVDFSFELEGGRLLEMTSSNIWKKVSTTTTGETYCLAMKRARGDMYILGMTQMLGKNFGFDQANHSLCYQNYACGLLG